MSEKVRTAILGLRHNHVSDLMKYMNASELFQFVAVAEDVPELLEKRSPHIVKELTHYTDYRELLEKEDIEAVVISTENKKKGSVVIDCLKRNIHALVDKPLLILKEGFDAVEAIISNGKTKSVLRLGFTFRMRPQYRKLKSMIQEGLFGEVAFVYSGAPHKLKAATRAPWELDEELNGGLILDLGVHAIDLFRWLTGKEVVQVTAAEKQVRECDFTISDIATIFCQMEDGATCLAEMDWLTPDKAAWHGDYRLRVIGSEGEAWFTVGANEFLFTTNTSESQQIEYENVAINMGQDFYNAIQGKESATTCEDALRATKVVLAAKESARIGKSVDVK